MKKNRYHVFLFSIVVLFLLVLTACSSSNNESTSKDEGNKEETADGSATVTVFKSHMGKGTIPGSDDPHVQYIKEKTGVEYQLESTPPAQNQPNILI